MGGVLTDKYKKFGRTSLNNGEADNRYLTCNKILTNGLTEFTTDFWIYFYGAHNAFLNGTTKNIVLARTPAFLLTRSNSSNIIVQFQDSSETWGNDIFLWTIIQNTWTHLAICVKNNIIYNFVNGKLINSTTCNIIISFNNIATYINYRNDTWDCNMSNVVLDEFRISSICRWTSDFTPPSFPYVGWDKNSFISNESIYGYK